MKNKVIIRSEPQPVAMADDWYPYATDNHFWMIGRFMNAAKKDMDHLGPDHRFLEIGCGNGTVAKQFEKNFGMTVDACDLNTIALEQIEDLKGDVYCLDIHDRPDDLQGKYDGILLFDVIEHIKDDRAFLASALSYLKPGGLVVINVPAFNVLFSKYDKVQGHERRYVTNDVRRLLADLNLQTLRVHYWGMVFFPLLYLRRWVLNFTPEEKLVERGFQMPAAWLNTFFRLLITWETKLLRRPPLGTSVMAVAKYKGSSSDQPS